MRPAVRTPGLGLAVEKVPIHLHWKLMASLAVYATVCGSALLGIRTRLIASSIYSRLREDGLNF